VEQARQEVAGGESGLGEKIVLQQKLRELIDAV
jgi:hypothetical protein